MAKNGIGILSVSLERLRIDTWDGWDCVDKPGNVKSIHNKDEPTVAVAVNFGAPAPLDALDAKFPDGRSDDSLQKIVNASCPSWHGMQLKSLADILHVEVRESRTFDDSEDPRAIVSLPVASVIESAFVNSDGDGAKRDISFESPDCKTSGTVTIRLKFHLQADVLAALAKGVGLEDATGASVVAADTLAAVKLGILKPDKETERRRMEADEADAFKQNNKNGKGSAQQQRIVRLQLHDRGDQAVPIRAQIPGEEAQPVRQLTRQLRTPRGAEVARPRQVPRRRQGVMSHRSGTHACYLKYLRCIV